jgi:hypothetical protein
MKTLIGQLVGLVVIRFQPPASASRPAAVSAPRRLSAPAAGDARVRRAVCVAGRDPQAELRHAETMALLKCL